MRSIFSSYYKPSLNKVEWGFYPDGQEINPLNFTGFSCLEEVIDKEIPG